MMGREEVYPTCAMMLLARAFCAFWGYPLALALALPYQERSMFTVDCVRKV